VRTRHESAEGREGAAVFGWSGDPIGVGDEVGGARVGQVLELGGQVPLVADNGDIRAHDPVGGHALSNHWRILREAGLTVTVRDGRHRRMSLRRDDLEERFPGLLTVILDAAVSAGV
jgi:hypothetical protein